MKRLVDLLRVNESRFTAIILGAMTIAAVINFNGQLGSGGGVPCLYDVYIIGILHGLIFGSYQVSSYTYKVGLNLGVNIIYPLIVMVIIFVLVNVAVRFKKKEFLGT